MQLSGPAVESALKGVAEGIVAQRPTRRLWIWFMPGLHAGIIRQAAVDLGYAKVLPDGIEIWPTFGGLSGAQWEALRQRCATMLGIPDSPVSPLGDFYRRWKVALDARMEREGIDPLPELQRPYPPALLARIDAAIARLEAPPACQVHQVRRCGCAIQAGDPYESVSGDRSPAAAPTADPNGLRKLWPG